MNSDTLLILLVIIFGCVLLISLATSLLCKFERFQSEDCLFLIGVIFVAACIGTGIITLVHISGMNAQNRQFCKLQAMPAITEVFKNTSSAEDKALYISDTVRNVCS